MKTLLPLTGLLLGLAALAASAQQPPSSSQPPPTSAEPHDAANPWHIVMEDGLPVCREPLPTRDQYPPGVYGISTDGPIKPPVAVVSPQAKFSDEARRSGRKKAFHSATWMVVLAMTADEQGMPKDICVVKKAGLGLDEQALQAAEKYRFQPATLDGKPVAVRLTIQVKFKLF